MSDTRYVRGAAWCCETPGIKWYFRRDSRWYLWRYGDSWWLCGGPYYVEKRMSMAFAASLAAATEYIEKV